jgi:signal transduction histidine kinase/CheY-like chemotaxis protein
MHHTTKKGGASLRNKIILALLLGCITIAVSWTLTKFTFSRMLATVHQLSEPNPKLQLVNHIFRDVVRLDQMQREQALQGKPRSYNPFFSESQHLRQSLDSLYLLTAGDMQQLSRIDSMKAILARRDKIFLNYLSLLHDFGRNDTIEMQMRSLSDLINNAAVDKDSIVTTEKKITTTTIENIDPKFRQEKQSFWERLTKKRKAPEVTKVKRLIQEELNIKIDTVAYARADSVVQELSKAISVAETDRSSKRNVLLKRQLQLNRSGNQLISQLLGILQDIETEELKSTQQNNTQATALVNRGLSHMNLILILFIGGAALLAFMIFTDIAKSNRYRRELIAAKEDAEELGHVKQRFLSNMSHELRTPLQAIVGVAEQIKMNDHAGAQDINIIYHSSQHLLQTVNELLDYSRIVSGRFALEYKAFNVKKLLDEIKDILRVQLDAKNLVLNYNVNIDASVDHMGDPFRLRQVLFNLLGNAIKFTDRGSVSLSAEQQDYKSRTVFTFTVADTGCGIIAADMDRIFNQFEQGSNLANQYQGTGLGLSIAKILVDEQQGSINLESTPGKGSLFTVILSFPKSGVKKETQPIPSTPCPAVNGTVVVVDDDAFILQLCDTILEKHRIRHVCYSSGLAALQAIPEDAKYVFLDIRMPGMSGIELSHALRQRLPGDACYIALTAQALPDEKDNILQQGFDRLLMKPFMEKDLLAILNTGDDITQTASVEGFIEAEDEADNVRILQSYILQTQNDLAALRNAIDGNEPLQAAEYLHRMAGRCAQMGDADFSNRLRGMERAIRKENDWVDVHLLQELCIGAEHIININTERIYSIS